MKQHNTIKKNKWSATYGFLMILVVTLLMQIDLSAQIRLNEVEIDTPSDISERCEYAEVRGTPGSTVPANTFFLSVDGDSGQFGQLSFTANIGGATFGSNGTLIIVSDSDTCDGRANPAGTTVVQTTSLSYGFGAETFILISTTQPGQIFEGQDIDANNDGLFDASFGITPIDGFGFVQNATFNRVYGGAPTIYDGVASGLDLPDAVTRFPNNLTAFDAAAFYFGELAQPENSVVYQAPLSPNFPVGGVLTPGAPNAPSVAAVRKAVADFNGDGKTDYSVTRNVGGQLNWFTSINGTSETRFVQWGLSADTPVPEDFDGDGRDDLAVWRAGNPFSAGFWILQSSTNTLRLEIFGQTGDNPGLVGDWDGDGKADPAVYRENAVGSQSYFYYRASNNNPNGNITFVPWGRTADKPMRGDFDGDGRLDAAVFRPGNSVWYIFQSSNSQSRYDYFGSPTDIFVTADYDGDSKTDLAVFRSGVWWIKQSSNNATLIQNWGLATDLPIPGDYNGDGRADFAVWRNGINYVSTSGGGSVIITNWGLSGDFPVANIYTE